MKKIFKAFLMGFLILISPILVKADMGAPMIKEYDVVVTDKNGLKMENSSTVIPYDTKVKVTYEYESGGKLLGSVEYNGKYGEIDLSKVKPFNEKVNYKDYDKLETPSKLYVFEKGAYLYKGPSKVYGKVDGNVEIPVGEEVEYQYHDDVWAYVTYKGTSGWVYYYQHSKLYSDINYPFASIKNNGKVLTISDVDSLLKSTNSEETVKADIKAFTEIDYKYYVNHAKTTYVYIDYKGNKGWLATYSDFGSSGGALKQSCSYLMVDNKNGITTYSKPGDINSKTDEVLKYASEIQLLYSYYDDDSIWYKINDGKKDLWLNIKASDESDNLLFGYDSYDEYTLKEDIELHKNYTNDSEVVGSVKASEKVRVKYSKYLYINKKSEQWGYVEKGDIKGWVLMTKDNFDMDSRKTVALCRDEDIDNDKDKDNDNENKENSSNKKDEKSHMSIMTIAGICVAGAVVLSLVVGVTMVIINKKKQG